MRRTATKRAWVPRPPPSHTSIAPFPIRQTRTLTFCDSFQMVMGTGVTTVNEEYRANSIFDPDAGGGSRQPYGHDTFETLYKHYSVKSSVIDISFAEFSGDTAFQPTMCGVWNNDDGTDITDKDLIREQPGSTSKLLTNNEAVSVRGVYNRNARYPAYGQNDVGAEFGVSPSETTIFNIFTARDDTSTTPENIVTAFIKITYEVEMWDPKKLGSS